MANPTMIRRLFATILAVATLWAAAALPAVAEELRFPSFTGYVVDAANILPADAESALSDKLKGFREKSGHQFAVATVPSLQGTTVEDFANRLFREWKLGDATRNDGVLMLVAPTERKVRIEVGYGLEGDLTDLVSHFIIQNAVLPRFKAGDMPGGVSRGVDDVIAVFSGQAEDYKARAAATEDDGELPLETRIFLVCFVLLFLYIFWQSFRGGGGGGRGRRASPWIIGGPGGWSGGGGGFSGGGGFGGGGGGSSGGGGASGGW